MPIFYHRRRSDEAPLDCAARETLYNSRKASSKQSSDNDPDNVPAITTQLLYDCYHEIAVDFHAILRDLCDALRSRESGQPLQKLVGQLKAFSEAIDRKRSEYLPDAPEDSELTRLRGDTIDQLFALALQIDSSDQAEPRQEALATRQLSQLAGRADSSDATGTNLQAPAAISDGQAASFDAPLPNDMPSRRNRVANQPDGPHRGQTPMTPRTACPIEYATASSTIVHEPHSSITRPPAPRGLRLIRACLGVKKSASGRGSSRNTQAGESCTHVPSA